MLLHLGAFYISFALNLKGKKDEARSVVPNVGRKIIKTFKIYFEGNEVLSINKYDKIMTYLDFWLAKTKLGEFSKGSTTPTP